MFGLYCSGGVNFYSAGYLKRMMLDVWMEEVMCIVKGTISGEARDSL